MTYRPEIETAASATGNDPDLVQAVVSRESGFDTTAYRYEPGFWLDYLQHNPKYQDKDPRVVSASYGLMQCMFPAAVDAGFTGNPIDLYLPATGLHWGCVILANYLKWARRNYTGLQTQAEGSIRRAGLAAYNGGKKGNSPNGPLKNAPYADAVIARYLVIKAAPK